MQIEKYAQENLPGQEIYLYTLSNAWMEISMLTLGCTITSIIIPGKDRTKRNIVLGYADAAAYLSDTYYIGSTVGRYAGRIGGASFSIDGHSYSLTANDGHTGNHLHGGFKGFNQKNFVVLSASKGNQHASLQFYCTSADGEEGYPGNLKLWVTITLTYDNKVIIHYEVTADQKTHINFTNHSYFNFTGLAEPATDHELLVNANFYVETGENYIPTGAIRPVTGTLYDFRKERKIDPDFNRLPTGYNECFVLDRHAPVNAILSEAGSGIRMSVSTSMPGLLLYTGDFLGGQFVKNQGISLETQFFPDSPNHQHFPSTLLVPGEQYVHNTLLAFDHL